MGWFSSDTPDHEGYAVGFVTLVKDGRRCDGIYRELGYADEDVARIDMVSAACECGWRSPRWKPSPWRNSKGEYTVPDFSPHTVFISEADEDRALELWREHVSHTTRVNK